MDDQYVTREEVDRIAEKAADRAAKRVLQDIGINAEDWPEHQADMRYLRQWRTGSETARLYVFRALLTVVVPGVLWLVWQGIKQAFKGVGQ